MKRELLNLGLSAALMVAPIAPFPTTSTTKVERPQESKGDGRFEMRLDEGAEYLFSRFDTGYVTVLMDQCVGWNNQDGGMTIVRNPGVYMKSTPTEFIAMYLGVSSQIKSFFRNDTRLFIGGINYDRTEDDFAGPYQVKTGFYNNQFADTKFAEIVRYANPYRTAYALVEKKGDQKMLVDTITEKPIMNTRQFTKQEVVKFKGDFTALCKSIPGGPPIREKLGR